LSWIDVDFGSCRISINKQRQYVSSKGIIEKTPKTDSSTRFVTVSDPIIKLLKKYRLEQQENRMKLGNLWNSDQVFTHETGEAFHPHRPYKWFTEFLERNELPKITFHQLRHTNASLLISQGVDIVTLSARLGHADKSDTLNTYSHMINSKEAQAAKGMAKFYSDSM
jgi:integrase